jgi:chitodextrinase
MKKVFVLIFVSIFYYSGVFSQVTCSATAASGSGYPAFIAADFGIENPDCEHTDFGAHITQIYDEELDRNVFLFHSHIDTDNDRCQVFDRVRMEVKGSGDSSEELQHPENSFSYYRWKFRIDENFIGASTFNHIFQNKAVGGDDDGFPILTLTLRANVIEFRQNGGDTGTDVGILAEASLELFRGKWVEAYLQQTHSENGNLELTLKDMETGLALLEYSATNLDLWRAGADFNRPKWGMYRAKNTILQDETIRFTDFCVSEVAEALCPAEAVLLPDTEAPTTPLNLTLNNVSISTANLSWNTATDNFGVTEYEILENEIPFISVADTFAILTDLTPATNYSFTVRAKDAAGNSSPLSNEVLVTTDNEDVLPDMPTDFAPINDATEVFLTDNLTWEAGNNTDSIRIFFGTTPDPPLVSSQVVNNYQPVLDPLTVYFWRIVAVNVNGETPGPLLTFTTADINEDFPWRVYRGNERPEIETNFLDLNEAPTAPPVDEVTSDPNGSSNNFFGFRSNTDEEFRWRHDFSAGDSVVTIVARFRAVSPSVNGICYFEIRNNGRRQKIRINQSTIKLEKTNPIVEVDLPFALTSEMHLFRIVSTGEFTSIYLDEKPLLVASGISDTPSSDAYFEWGKSGGADYGARIDWLTMHKGVSDAPGEGADLPDDLFLSSNAFLSNLQVDGTTVNDFSSNTFDYTVSTIEGNAPVLSWTTVSELATVNVANPPTVPDTQANITVTAQDGFTQTTYTINYIGTSSLQEQNIHKDILIFPNPTQQEIRIVLGEQGTGIVSIFDTSGQKIQGDIFIDNEKKIKLGHITKGAYFVRIDMGQGQVVTKKITIE